MTMEANQLVEEEVSSHDLYMIKCVVIGDTGVGKTRLICSRACGTRYPLAYLMQTHVPTVWAIDQYQKNSQALKKSWCSVDGVTVSLRLWDTFGDHNKDRRFAFGRADVVLVCFSVVQPRSLRNVVSHWFREIQQLCPGVPVILCGCQVDLRYLYNDPAFLNLDKGPFFREITDRDILLPDAGRLIAKKIGAYYYETSVLDQFGISTLFTNVARAALIYKRERHFWTAFGALKHISHPQYQAPHLPPRPCPPDVPTLTFSSKIDFDRCLLESEAFCDVIFLVRNVRIKAHRATLAAASPVFETLFLTKETPLIKIPHYTRTDWCHLERTLSDGSSSSDSFNFMEEHIQDSISSASLSEVSTSSSELYHPVFRCIELQHCATSELHSGCEVSIVAVDESISPSVFRAILSYLYAGLFPQSLELLNEVRIISEMIGLSDLADAVTNILSGQDFMNLEIVNHFRNQKCERIRNLIIKKSLFADIVFQLDDGMIHAHRALLMPRCDVMSRMFTCDFREKSAKLVSFPGVTTDTFSVLQEFLYTGSSADFSSVCFLSLIELANRLCLKDLLTVAEQSLVEELTALEKSGQDVTEDVLMLLEQAQLHNAKYVNDWCLWYLKVNYDGVYKRYSKVLHRLKPDNQIVLMNHRWPPLWYVKENDLFEKHMLDLQREKQKSMRSCLLCGCGHLSSLSIKQGNKIKCKSFPTV